MENLLQQPTTGLRPEHAAAISGTMHHGQRGPPPTCNSPEEDFMQIDRILRTKGNAVATVSPSVSVGDAARDLARLGVGALVVSSDGERIDGILSERDITRAVGVHGPEALNRRVDELMTREVTTCSMRDTVDDLAEVMTTHRVRHLPVLEDGRLAGIVSIGDVVKNRLDELKIEAQTLHEYILTGR
jgi:CBS domain-containing protein